MIRTDTAVGEGSVRLTDAQIEELRRLVYTEAGIALNPEKRELLSHRLSPRLRALRLDGDVNRYLHRARSDAAELTLLLDSLTTNETRFYREPDHFEHLQHAVLGRLEGEAARGQRARVVRLWSAACSTGEEPYTLAMLLLASAPSWRVEIVASDLCTRALATAREGRYRAERAAALPIALKQRYLLRGTGPAEGLVQVRPEVQSCVTFRRVNLGKALPADLGSFDAIFCRNVFIYFDVASRREAVLRLMERLNPRGVLYLGNTETLHGVNVPLRAVAPSAYARPDAREAP
ncbi:MAG: protein-glutamate O-methyltransferase CheR [Polyangiales bacterium]